jgi:hypothetical protein
MIQGVTSGGQVGMVAMTALRYAQTDGAQIVLPVRPSDAIHANFRHINVLPDATLQDGVPLYKLRILDSLIDQLSRTSGGRGQTAGGTENVDSMLESMSRELRAAGTQTAPYRAGFFFEPGAFIDLVA